MTARNEMNFSSLGKAITGNPRTSTLSRSFPLSFLLRSLGNREKSYGTVGWFPFSVAGRAEAFLRSFLRYSHVSFPWISATRLRFCLSRWSLGSYKRFPFRYGIRHSLLPLVRLSPTFPIFSLRRFSVPSNEKDRDTRGNPSTLYERSQFGNPAETPGNVFGLCD